MNLCESYPDTVCKNVSASFKCICQPVYQLIAIRFSEKGIEYQNCGKVSTITFTDSTSYLFIVVLAIICGILVIVIIVILITSILLFKYRKHSLENRTDKENNDNSMPVNLYPNLAFLNLELPSQNINSGRAIQEVVKNPSSSKLHVHREFKGVENLKAAHSWADENNKIIGQSIINENEILAEINNERTYDSPEKTDNSSIELYNANENRGNFTEELSNERIYAKPSNEESSILERSERIYNLPENGETNENQTGINNENIGNFNFEHDYSFETHTEEK